jgi:hypothetical protein
MMVHSMFVEVSRWVRREEDGNGPPWATVLQKSVSLGLGARRGCVAAH